MRINSSFQRIEGDGIFSDMKDRILSDMSKSVLSGISNIASKTGNVVSNLIDTIPLSAEQQHRKNMIIDYENKKKEKERLLKERNARFGFKGRFF